MHCGKSHPVNKFVLEIEIEIEMSSICRRAK